MRISHNSPSEGLFTSFLNKPHILVNFLLIFTILIAVYALTYRGAFRVDDEHILAARSQSLALWGELSEPQVYGNERVRYLAALPGEHGSVRL